MIQISEQRHALMDKLLSACREFRAGRERRLAAFQRVFAGSSRGAELRELLDGGVGGRIIDLVNQIDRLPPEKPDHLREPAKMIAGGTIAVAPGTLGGAPSSAAETAGLSREE